MPKKVAIIGGSGYKSFDPMENPQKRVLKTLHGEVEIVSGSYKGCDVIFFNRHTAAYVLPHQINFLANNEVLVMDGVDCVFSTASVGSMNPKMKSGDFAVPTDIIDFTKNRPHTFSGRFTEMSDLYNPDLTKKLIKSASELKQKIHKSAIYVCAEGPRFETSAEIRMFQKLGGDIVGMTQIPEVIFAKEAGIPYCALAVVTNMAQGIKKKRLSLQEMLDMMNERSILISSIFAKVIETLL